MAHDRRQPGLLHRFGCFLDRGYATTTMDAVARDAGVAVQTGYFTFRTKGALLQAMYEHVVLGPEHLPPHLTSWWRAVDEEPDVALAVRALVSATMGLLLRAAPLVWTVVGDETARADTTSTKRCAATARSSSSTPSPRSIRCVPASAR